MKKLGLLVLLLLAACQTDDMAARDHAMADRYCRQPSSEPYKTCYAREMENYRILDGVAAARVAQQPRPYYADSVMAAPEAPAQPLPNILPPTTRCQTVPAGMGTYQTVCR